MSNRVRHLVRFVRNKSCGVRKGKLSNEGQHFARFVRNRSCGVRKCKNAHLSMRVFRCLWHPRRAAFATPRPPSSSCAPLPLRKAKDGAPCASFLRPHINKTKKRYPRPFTAPQSKRRRAVRRADLVTTKSKDMFTSSRSSNRCTACRKAGP